MGRFLRRFEGLHTQGNSPEDKRHQQRREARSHLTKRGHLEPQRHIRKILAPLNRQGHQISRFLIRV